MKRTIIALCLAAPTVAFATGGVNENPWGGLEVSPKAFATSKGGAGGLGGTGTGGNVGNISQENKSYGIGAPGLAASANACQGSVSIAVVGFTYTVEFCRALQEVTMMTALGLSKESILNRLCQVDTVAETASECVGRKIEKK